MTTLQYPFVLRLLHLLLVLTGIIAWLTGDLAEDGGFGYSVHSLIGLAVMGVVSMRVLYGLVAASPNRFWQWWPFSASNLARCKEDLLGLLKLKVPERELHEGISGVVQLFGLLLFVWMAATGTVLYIYPEHEHGLLHLVEEVHGIGEGLIPAFLVLHLGGLLAHLIKGDHSALQKMFGFRR